MDPSILATVATSVIVSVLTKRKRAGTRYPLAAADGLRERIEARISGDRYGEVLLAAIDADPDSYIRSSNFAQLLSEYMAVDEEFASGIEYLVAEARGQVTESRGATRSRIALQASRLETARSVGDQAVEADAFLQAGAISEDAREYKEAARLYEIVLNLATEISWQTGLVAAHTGLGRAAWSLQDFDTARNHYHQALSVARNDPAIQSSLLAVLGQIEHDSGQVQTAIAYLQRSLLLARDADDQYAESGVLTHLGSAYREIDDLQSAREAYQAALAIAERLSDRRTATVANSNLGNLHASAGELDEAEASYAKSLTFARESGDKSRQFGILINLGMLVASQGRLNQAIEYLQSAARNAEERDSSSDQARALSILGGTFTRAGQYDNALTSLTKALFIAERIKDDARRTAALNELGLLYAARGLFNEAASNFSQALSASRNLNDQPDRATAQYNLAVAWLELGRLDDAHKLFEASAQEFGELGDESSRQLVLRALGDVPVGPGFATKPIHGDPSQSVDSGESM